MKYLKLKKQYEIGFIIKKGNKILHKKLLWDVIVNEKKLLFYGHVCNLYELLVCQTQSAFYECMRKINFEPFFAV